MAATSPDNISYPVNTDAQKSIEDRIYDTAASVQAALDTKASLSGATFTGNVTLNGTTSTSDTRIINVQSLGYAGIRLNGDTSNDNTTEPGGAFVSLGRDASNNAVFLSAVQNAGYSGLESNGTITDTTANSGLLYSSSVMHIGTSTAVRMTIDAAGRITTPYQPAFFVKGTGTQAWSGAATTTKLVMNGTVFTNIGSHYSTTNSRFTAPVAGAYLFNLAACPTSNSTGPEMHLYVNGTSGNANSVVNLAIGYDATYNTFGASAILDLSASDYVEMFIVNNNGVSFSIDRGRSTFSGYLLG